LRQLEYLDEVNIKIRICQYIWCVKNTSVVKIHYNINTSTKLYKTGKQFLMTGITIYN